MMEGEGVSLIIYILKKDSEIFFKKPKSSTEMYGVCSAGYLIYLKYWEKSLLTAQKRQE